MNLNKPLPANATLEPLFPGSHVFRQARLGSLVSDDVAYSNENDSQASVALMPDPHAWYAAHRAMPDVYLEPVKDKQLPYVLITEACAIGCSQQSLITVFQGVAETPCNVFLMVDHETPHQTLDTLKKKLLNSNSNIKAVYTVASQNNADTLSLIRQADYMIGNQIAELVDGIALKVKCVWPLENNTWSLNDDAQAALQTYAMDRLKNHTLIETEHDLTELLNLQNSTDDTLSESHVASGSKRPIMPIALSQQTLTPKQKRALAVSAINRKFKKFRESPKRFLTDSKLNVFRTR